LSFNSAVIVTVFTLLAGVDILQLVNFILVACLFLLKFSKLVSEVVNVFAESKSTITLSLNISLGSKNFSLTTRNLFTSSSNLSLNVVVCSVFLIQEETSVIELLLESVKSYQVGVVACLEVIVLQ